MKRSVQIIGVFIAVLIFITILLVSTKPKDYKAGTAGAPVLITVSNGESGTAIAQDLASKSVVLKASVLIVKIIASKVAVGIAPGIHRIDTHIPSDLAITELLDQKRIVDSISVLPGSTESDVLKLLHAASSLKQDDQLSTIKPFFPNTNNSLEGQIAPEQYSFEPGTTTGQALSTMVKSFADEITHTKIQSGYLKYQPYQLLIIASLLQIEADPGDYSKAARVIYNRLQIGMPLQLNSTVQYAAGLRGQIGLSTASTKIDSPYNTYLHIGLPPTPISNPTVAAISGALNPESGSWLYFITVAPHDTRFTASYTTFQSWVNLYNKNVAAGAFK
ncbi:MAG: endolytic transglycosylase MltG [Actinomycetota bacterium]